jgi:hypothetical protein
MHKSVMGVKASYQCGCQLPFFNIEDLCKTTSKLDLMPSSK